LALRRVDQRYGGSFETLCWERTEKTSWAVRVKNGELLRKVKEECNIVLTVKIRKANRTGYSLLRNCLLKHVIEGKNPFGNTRKKA